MDLRERSERCFLIYQGIREKTRIPLRGLGKILGLSGRGKTTSTVSRHLQKMYELQITFKPNLILRGFENSFVTAYFLRAVSRKDVSSLFTVLKDDPRISYAVFLSGAYDFFVTSREPCIDFRDDVSVVKKSVLYTPIYTVPYGWDKEMRECLISVANAELEKGLLDRELEDFLPWDEIDWHIFHSMRFNARKQFTDVGRETGVSSDTAKKRFYENVLPYCDVANYFFPKGYDHYNRSFVILHSDHEKGLVNALSKLPCTSYVYPLEDELALILFHEGINDVVTAFLKLEEAGFIEDHLLLTPAWHWWF